MAKKPRTKKNTTPRKRQSRRATGGNKNARADAQQNAGQVSGQQIAEGLAALVEVANGCDEKRERQLRDRISLGVRVVQLILQGQITLGQGGQTQAVPPAPKPGDEVAS